MFAIVDSVIERHQDRLFNACKSALRLLKLLPPVAAIKHPLHPKQALDLTPLIVQTKRELTTAIRRSDPLEHANELTSEIILNRCEALILTGFFTSSELASYLGKPRQRVFEWVMERKYKPGADVLFRMRDWAAGHTLLVASSADLQRKYRAADRKVIKKRKQPCTT